MWKQRKRKRVSISVKLFRQDAVLFLKGMKVSIYYYSIDAKVFNALDRIQMRYFITPRRRFFIPSVTVYTVNDISSQRSSLVNSLLVKTNWLGPIN